MTFHFGTHFHMALRFSYCALNCLALLGKLDCIDMKKAVEFGTDICASSSGLLQLMCCFHITVARCQNYDGGFGVVPGAESHAGQGNGLVMSFHVLAHKPHV